ncbi:hypothetical protein Palpr_0381 [Paludibacter propionicigenes WB4]|uniref:Uncharacterized protein n=1 Tax=Paludibacter propionicigenes (strain DSM 17365 / JCM 13257 / WB4) TaxID=694427 RepID=E4T1E8_PALPW|nr:hypothetical protein Palpr_0381 [Paludibacter propionicigenes WB4]
MLCFMHKSVHSMQVFYGFRKKELSLQPKKNNYQLEFRKKIVVYSSKTIIIRYKSIAFIVYSILKIKPHIL